MFPFLSQLSTAVQQLKTDAEDAYAALSQLVDLAVNGPPAP